MKTIFEVGNVIEFVYEGRPVRVRIDSVVTWHNWVLGDYTYSVTGWDFLADLPVGGYRTFLVYKMSKEIELVN